MKVKVKIISAWCILMCKIVTVPSLTMLTSIVSEEWCKGHKHYTHTHTYTHILVYHKTLKKQEGLGTRLTKVFKVKVINTSMGT